MNAALVCTVQGGYACEQQYLVDDDGRHKGQLGSQGFGLLAGFHQQLFALGSRSASFNFAPIEVLLFSAL